MKTCVILTERECECARNHIQHVIDIIRAKRISEKDKNEIICSLLRAKSVLEEDVIQEVMD